MKRFSVVVLLLAMSVLLLIPSTTEARGPWRGYPYRGYSHGGCSGCWWVPGAIITGGIVLGALLTRPWTPPPERTVYVYPEATVVAPAPPRARVYDLPGQAYAAPDPEFLRKHGGGGGKAQESPPGEWVMVPGQWVEGRWVPTHKAWVPVNP